MFRIGEWCGGVEIRGKDRIPSDKKGLIVICNHPSLWEPILLGYLFYPNFVRHPSQLPLGTPDGNNYYKKLRWLFLRPIFLPIDRGKVGDVSSFRRMRDAIKSGRSVMVFPEGGRTFKGDSFAVAQSGKKIRQFKRGIAMIALNLGAPVLPVWVENTDKVVPQGKIVPRIWRKSIIKVGQLIETKDLDISSEEFNSRLMAVLLALADE
ncbi:MAG: lysophospholipid acyltransferase family protein [Candidatus Falkowbacteria bacterium]